MYVAVTVITHPNNVSGCVGGTAVFTCIMRFQNVIISKEDIKWWTIRSSKRLIRTQGTNTFSITSNISGGTLSTVLMINGLRSALIGPFWLGMANGTQLSDVAFLSITPSGMYTVAMSSLYVLRMCCIVVMCDMKYFIYCLSQLLHTKIYHDSIIIMIRM